MTKETAMNKYISELRKVDASFENTNTPSISAAPAILDESPMIVPRIIMEGTMYKQRDVFKGWRPRYFVLDDNFLHYFLKKGDDIPKKSIQIFGGSVTVVRSTRVGDIEYHPFVLSHPKSTKTYNFSVDSKELADQWITALKEVVIRDSPGPMANIPLDRILKRRPDEDDVKKTCAPVSPDLTLTHIPEKYALKIEYAVETLVDLVSPQSSTQWKSLFEKNGVIAFKRPGSVVCIRADSLLPLSLLDIFSLLMNDTKQKEIDMSIKSTKRLKSFSENTSLMYTRYKQVWPLTVRDFCNLVHWRLLPDGTVVIAAFSEKFEDLCPLEDGILRGELILGGYVLRQTPKGTQCHYVVQVDLKSTLPASVINLLSSIQPMNLANIRTYLESTVHHTPRHSLLSRPNKPITFQGRKDASIPLISNPHIDLLFAFETSKTKSTGIAPEPSGEDSGPNRQSTPGTPADSSSATEKVCSSLVILNS
jgi:hypothetical protein